MTKNEFDAKMAQLRLEEAQEVARYQKQLDDLESEKGRKLDKVYEWHRDKRGVILEMQRNARLMCQQERCRLIAEGCDEGETANGEEVSHE